MSVPDYTHSAQDHRTLLVLVKRIGDQMNQKTFNQIYDKISRIQHVEIKETSGIRSIWLRYKKTYPVVNNEWGDFQTYRKVLGLISVGSCGLENEVEELCKEHNTLQEKYNSIFDSRCLVFSSNNSSPPELVEQVRPLDEKSSENSRSPIFDNSQSVFKDEVEPVPKSHISYESDSLLYQSPKPSDSDFVDHNELDESLSVSLTQEYHSLPNVSVTDSQFSDVPCVNDMSHEGNSIDNSLDTEAFDGNSPSASKKIIIPSALSSRSTHCVVYPGVENCDQLEQDIKEFINSLFWILESKRLDRSFEKQDKITLITASFEKKNYVGIDQDTRVYKKRCLGRMRKYIGDLALQTGLPLEALTLYVSATELLRATSDWLWLASAYEGQCSASVAVLYPTQNTNVPLQRNSSYPLGIYSKVKNAASSHSKTVPNGVDPLMTGRNVLTFSEMAEKYQEAILNYRKYQGALVIEAECSIKAAKVLALQEKYLEASEFLKNVVFTSLQQNDEEKMQRFNALALLYKEIGFHRKTSFFKRIAAMRCVAKTNPKHNWSQCYFLTLESLEGFKLSLDIKEFPKDIIYGWPALQIRVLHDLVGIATRMDNQALAVRHMTFLLHTLLEHLCPSEQQSFCAELEELTSKCEGAPVPLALDNGFIIPPVNLLNLPYIKTFKLLNLAPHLRPVKMNSNQAKLNFDDDPIFIFSPIAKEKDKQIRSGAKLDFKWVEGDVCEVALQVFNPLPFELKVTHMGLQADGIAFESFPSCLSLPAESGPYPVNLLGTPLSSGELQILGYTTHVLGVKSSCRLKDISAIRQHHFVIDVIPRLPQLQVTTSLPKASTFSSLGDTSYIVSSAAVTMYAGESRECTITLSNSGQVDVEKIDLSLHTKLKKDKEVAFFTWSKEKLDAQLPITIGSSASFTLYINAIGEFIHLLKLPTETCALGSGDHKNTHSSTSSLCGTPNKRKPQAKFSPEFFPSKIIEAVVQIQYSGGPGMAASYCRKCAIAIIVEVLPSLVITKWDVLPSEIPSYCYLVLDILNATSHEMEVQYAANKQILIEANDICRVPVYVERCPLLFSCIKNDGAAKDATQHKKSDLLDTCQRHLINLVDIRWALSSLDICGRASISDITWTDDMLNFILMSPIQWDIYLNGNIVKTEDELSFVVGDLIKLRVKVINISDVVLRCLHLFIRGYQDHQNGHQSYRMEAKRAIIGCDKAFIKEVLPYEECFHECGLVFFHTGVYRLDILCSHKDKNTNWPEYINSADSCITDQNSMPTMDDQTYFVQKCAPSIDITVIED